MANFATVITNAGTALQTQALGSGAAVQFNAAYIGDGVPAAQANKVAFTSLVHSVRQVNIGVPSFVQDPGGNHTDIPVQVTNEGLSVPVYVREIGIFARIGTGTPVLYAYSWLTDSGDSGDNTLLPPPSGVDYNVVRNYVVSCIVGQLDTAHVTVNTSPATMIRYDQMQTFVAQAVLPLSARIDALTASQIATVAPQERKAFSNVQDYLSGLWDGLKSFVGYNPSSFATAAQGTKADSALPATSRAADSAKLNGQAPSYYLSYSNLANTPAIPTVPAYSTTTPLADGTATAGTANSISRGNHRHPIPTRSSLGMGSLLYSYSGGAWLTSFNVPRLQEYTMYAVRLNDSNTVIPCFRHSTDFRGCSAVGTFSAGSNKATFYTVFLKISGETLFEDDTHGCQSFVNNTTGGATNRYVAEIRGIY